MLYFDKIDQSYGSNLTLNGPDLYAPSDIKIMALQQLVGVSVQIEVFLVIK